MQVEARRVPARDSVRQTLGADSLAHLVEKVLAPRSRSQGLVPVGAALCHVIAVVGTLDLEAVGAIHVDGRRKTNGVDGCGHIRVPREVPHDARLVRVPVNLVEKRVPPGIVVRGAAQVGGHETVLGDRTWARPRRRPGFPRRCRGVRPSRGRNVTKRSWPSAKLVVD